MCGTEVCEYRVDRDAAVGGELHARRLETEAADVRPPAESRTSPGRRRPSCRSDSWAHRPCLAMLSTASTVLPRDDLDAALLHLRAQVRAHVVVETAQDVFAAVDQRHLRAETGERCRRTRPRYSRRPGSGCARAARSRWNASFEEITCSMPGIAGPMHGRGAGRDQHVRGAHRCSPFASRRTVCGSSITARLLTIVTPARSSVVV